MMMGDSKGESFKLPSKETRLEIRPVGFPNREEWNRLTKKYGTKSPELILRTINDNIRHTTSLYK